MKQSFVLIIFVLIINASYLMYHNTQSQVDSSWEYEFENKIKVQGSIDDPSNRIFYLEVFSGVGSTQIIISMSQIRNTFTFELPLNQSTNGYYILWVYATATIGQGQECHCLSLSVRIADTPGLHMLYFPLS